MLDRFTLPLFRHRYILLCLPLILFPNSQSFYFSYMKFKPSVHLYLQILHCRRMTFTKPRFSLFCYIFVIYICVGKKHLPLVTTFAMARIRISRGSQVQKFYVLGHQYKSRVTDLPSTLYCKIHCLNRAIPLNCNPKG